MHVGVLGLWLMLGMQHALQADRVRLAGGQSCVMLLYIESGGKLRTRTAETI